jgi:hypothetical protein
MAVAVALPGVAVGLLVASQPAMAHHSFALFDTNRTVRVEGVVKRFDWTNPHSWITLEVFGPDNTVAQWMIELPAAGTLARDGWNKNYLKVGEKLIVRVNPLKDGRNGGMLASFTPESRAPNAR